MFDPDTFFVFERDHTFYQEVQLRKGIRYIDMDQTTDLEKLNSLLSTFNDTDRYNFSEATALELIREYMQKQFTLHQPTTIILICLYIPVFFLSLLGNGLVVFVVIRNQHMRRVKNLFLLNLALADLFVTLICMPMVVGQTVFRLWVYGPIMCRLSVYTQGVAVTTSIFTLTALSIDRYLAIKAPLSLRRISSKCQATTFLAIIWLLACIFVLPMLIVRSVYAVTFNHFHISMAYCVEKWPSYMNKKMYGLIMLVVNYVIPIVTITTCYSMIGRALCSDEFHRKTSDSSSTVMLGRKRVARMLVALIVVFLLCWLPYNITSLSLDFEPSYRETRVLPFAMLLAHAHSAINPLLYWFLNKGFRHCMKKALRCQPVKKSHKDTPSPQWGRCQGRYLSCRLCDHGLSRDMRLHEKLLVYGCPVGGDIDDVLKFELRPGGLRFPRSSSSLHRESPSRVKVVRLQIHGRPRSSSSSFERSRSSSSAERHPIADRRTTPRRFVRLDYTPPTSSSRMLTATSGQTGSSHQGIVSLEVHYETPDTMENRLDGDVSRSPSVSTFGRGIEEEDSSV